MTLSKAQSGQLVILNDRSWNELLDRVNGKTRVGSVTGRRSDRSPIGGNIQIKNNTGAKLEQGSIVGIGDPVTAPGDIPEDRSFRDAHLFYPIATDVDTKEFAIIYQTIGVDHIGEAVVAGSATAIVDVGNLDHGYAVPSATDGRLKSTDVRSSLIIDYAQQQGDGELCKVRWVGTGDGIVFPIDLETIAGAAGGVNTKCSYRYMARRRNMTPVIDADVDVNDATLNHVWGRPDRGAMSEATRGMAFYENERLIITYLNEQKLYAPCEEQTATLNQEAPVIDNNAESPLETFEVSSGSMTELTEVGGGVFYPAGLVAGDLFMIVGMTNGSTTLTSPPFGGADQLSSGVENLNGTRRTQILYRIIDGTEAATYSLTNDPGGPPTGTTAVYTTVVYKGVGVTSVNQTGGQSGLSAPSKTLGSSELEIVLFAEGSDTLLSTPPTEEFQTGVNKTLSSTPTAMQVAAYRGLAGAKAPSVSGGSANPSTVVITFN